MTCRPGSDSSKTLDIFVNAVSLLRSLCEASPSALQVFNGENVLASLLGATDANIYNQIVVGAVCKSMAASWEVEVPSFFRCILASLKEGVSVRRSVRPTQVEKLRKGIIISSIDKGESGI